MGTNTSSRSSPGETTPAPWVNVLANPNFGTLISESGGSYTWSENCHEFRLTPWSNDAVTDASGEAFYIRDEQSGIFWSPTPLPARGQSPYVSRHGFGYSVFEHTEVGISSELQIYVSIHEPVKFAVLKLKNNSDRRRRLSVTGYWELVLGGLRQKSAMHIATEIDQQTGALLARNPYNTDFEERVAFVTSSEFIRSFTADRTEFFGRNGTLAQPAALRRVQLSGKTGAGFDPCAALQAPVELEPGQEREIAFILGVGQNLDHARDLVRQFQNLQSCHEELQKVWDFWKQTLGVVQVETPEPALNLLANGWLLYQTISCRLVGAHGILSIRRRVRFSRSASGCHDARPHTAGIVARTTAPRRRAPISRRRRAALVASADRSRCAHAFFRRLFVAALCDLPLRRNGGRHWRAG